VAFFGSEQDFTWDAEADRHVGGASFSERGVIASVGRHRGEGDQRMPCCLWEMGVVRLSRLSVRKTTDEADVKESIVVR
jgi:hypothetical protein